MIEKKNEMSEKLIWTTNDEYPTVIECENVDDTKEKLNCFYNYLYDYLSNNLKNNGLLKNLEFNESSKKYKIKTGGTKNRSVSKSRSNIDRLTKKK